MYLDIDGVLLGKRGTIPDDLEDFLRFAKANFECYWLTTHCKGDSRTALRYLEPYFAEEVMTLLADIRPTHWDAMKTEGIDFDVPFVWLDDQPFEAEKRMLELKGSISSLIVVDLRRSGELRRVKAMLISRFVENG